MGLSQLADAAAAPALEKGRPFFDVLHFVWQSLFGSPATEITQIYPLYIRSTSSLYQRYCLAIHYGWFYPMSTNFIPIMWYDFYIA